MFRLLAGLAAALLLAGSARAQEKKTDAAETNAKTKAAAAPPEVEKKTESAEIDAKTKAAIQREVDKAKEDLRNEVRAEMQGAQSAAEFLGAVAEGPKLAFFELDGYYRVRGQLMDDLDLGGGKDASNHFLFPVPLGDPTHHSTLSTANMRLRLEPTLNVSEHVRVRAQIDVLDNYVLGSSTSNLYDDPASPYPVPFYGSSRAVLQNDPRADRPAVSPKRAWAEVQTPVGLLSFGRMPSEWGLGILTSAGSGIDDDYGDTVDRIQFALPPVTTPIGRLTFVPILDFDAEGVLYTDPHFGPGVGQPFDAEPGDDGRTYGVKVARLDTDDEVRRKLERNETSVNYGAYYNYRTQRWVYPEWLTQGLATTYPDTTQSEPARSEHVSAYAHVLDLWFRLQRPRWRIEAELVGVWGNIGKAWAFEVDPLTNQPVTDPTTGLQVIDDLGRVLLRQWGGSVVAEVKAIPNRLTFGVEVGAASGDDAPGFGTSRVGMTPSTPFGLALYGSLDGPQFGCTTATPTSCDNTIRNFRFNPAYRVDLVLFRHILGQVTDAAYAKPKLRWEILPGLTLDAAVIYSRAIMAQSTPSAGPDGKGADASLGIEGDGVLTYTSGDGFQAFGEWGVLQPLKGLAAQGVNLSRGHFLAFGFAVKF